MYSKELLETSAEFNKDVLEKVLRLIDVLEYINNDDYLSKYLVLKGGTAINLRTGLLPRLSVDIDLDFNCDCSKDEMLEARGKITENIVNFMDMNGYVLEDKTKEVAALDSFVFSFTNHVGNHDTLKIEINYLMRNHIYDPEKITKNILPAGKSVSFISLNKIELYGAKISALLQRGAARDLFDVANMIKDKTISNKDLDALRKSVLFYITVGYSKPKEYIEINQDKIDSLKLNDVKRKLIPVLKKGTFYDLEKDKEIVKTFMDDLLSFEENENRYLEQFKNGNYMPELLFSDKKIIKKVKNHPMALWKTKDK